MWWIVVVQAENDCVEVWRMQRSGLMHLQGLVGMDWDRLKPSEAACHAKGARSCAE